MNSISMSARQCFGGGYARFVSFCPDDPDVNECFHFMILLRDFLISIQSCKSLALKKKLSHPLNVSPGPEHLFDQKHIEYS